MTGSRGPTHILRQSSVSFSLATLTSESEYGICIGSTMAQVRLELAQEEARDGALSGEGDDERMCVNTFLYRGLELEEQQ